MPDPSSPLVAEAFESTGTGTGAGGAYDETGWTEDIANGGTLNANYTTSPAPLHGNQSFRTTTTAANDNARIYKNFTSGAERWAYCLIRPVALPSAGHVGILSFWSDFVEAAVVQLNSNGTLTLYSGTPNQTTTGAMSVVATYHLWLHYNNTTNVADVAFSTDGIRPTAGSTFVQVTGSDVTGGTNSGDADRIVVGGGASDGSSENIFDRVFVDDEQIGDMVTTAPNLVRTPSGKELLRPFNMFPGRR